GVATVPAGTYVAAEVTLDFTDASVVIGGQTTPATVLDADGTPLGGSLVLPIDLPSGSLAVGIGKNVLLELDVDLDQSLVVDPLANSVWVEPVLILRVDPIAPKQLFAVGTLAAADAAAGTFSVQVETFGGVPGDTLDFLSQTSTVYHVDGGAAQGSAGLTELAAKPVGTAIQVLCTLDPSAAVFEADVVAAGTGTINGGADVVDGWVLARSAGAGGSPVLTVRGTSLDAALTTFQFGEDFSVTTVFGTTKVLIPGTLLPLDLDDVNVGQRVRIFGALTGTSLDATTASDVVKLWPTRAFGLAAGAPLSGTQTFDLTRIGPILEGQFTWADSGTVPTDPLALTAAVGGLGSGLAIDVGTPIEVRGYFSAVDAAGDDMVALGLTNLASAPSLLFVRDLAGSGLDLDVTALTALVELGVTGTAVAGETAVVDQGFAGSLPLPASPTPALEPAGSGLGLFLVYDSVQGTTRLHLSFGAFAADLAGSIAGGAHVRHVAGIGPWDATTNRLSTALASAGLE
ncbi:MAG TPA: hypothetical protein VMT18_01835, partial [Planctomycetota bacterium]|nr:hypothetical protein [Planctomycetota bacterium]